MTDLVELDDPQTVIAEFDEQDAMAIRLGLDPLAQDAAVRAAYLEGYANIISKKMYGGERPSGVWNLEQAAKLLRDQSRLIAALRAHTAQSKGEQE